MIPSINEAEGLLGELIERDRKTNKILSRPKAFYNHCRGVSNLAYLISCGHRCGLTWKRYNINPELVQVAGLLDDIGKCVYTEDMIKGDPNLEFDSIVGVNYLKNLGYGEVANVIKPSFVTKEMLELSPHIFPEIDPNSLEPETLEQEIVVYADAHVTGTGKIVSLDERIQDIKNRYPSDSPIVRALIEKGGLARLRSLSERIEKAIGLI